MTIIIDVVPLPHTRTKERDCRWRVTLAGDHIGDFREPFYDGARALLARGHDPAAMLQMRHANGVIGLSGNLGETAKWTVADSDSRFQIVRWRPMAFSFGDVSSKDGVEAIPAPSGQGEGSK